MPIIDAAQITEELQEKIRTYVSLDKYKYLSSRMAHTPVYNDQNHLERAAVSNDRILAFICFTLDWEKMICSSCSVLSFEVNFFTCRLIVAASNEVFNMGFSEINFLAAKENQQAVNIWSRSAENYFSDSKTSASTIDTENGPLEVINWKVFPKRHDNMQKRKN